ncbi:MAG: DUF4384 domain-containing protein [Symploca sp. SIO2C1]|nr:DUF4384 domain-containing protein [Symploca sp. SIO2C1]
MKRRRFLQFSGSVLASAGLSVFHHQYSDRFVSTTEYKPRKLALLVGINQYHDSDRVTDLQGCITDVELQRQLLIHRYGFHPQDILTLTNEQATRHGILQGFEKHLIGQAQPADVVVFHFSGQGVHLADSDCGVAHCFTSSLVPFDSTVNSDGSVSDITQATLWLLMAALKTENVTFVLDTNYAGWGRSETLPAASGSPVQPRVSAEEKAYQQQCLAQLGLSPAEFIHLSRTGIPKGVLIAAAGNNQFASELPFSDFHAGVFTYLMTQHLWQQTGNERVESAIANITRSVVQVSTTDQVPELTVKPNSGNQQQPAYFLKQQTPPAEAVITQVEGDWVELWLGGLQPNILPVFANGSVLAIVDQASQEQGLVQLESRQGLVGKGKVLAASPHAVEPGALLQERVRGIPKNLTLRIGLDSSLGKDKTTAEQALQGIKGIEVLPLQLAEVDYILSRMTTYRQQELASSLEATLPAVGSIGLFSPAYKLIPDSFGTQYETIQEAVTRLRAKLKSLLAVRLVKLALNGNSSRLNVAANLTLEGDEQAVISEAVTVRGASSNLTSNKVTSAEVSNTVPTLNPGTSVQFHLTNNEPCELYCSILVISSEAEIVVLFPHQWTATNDVMRVEAQQTLRVPEVGKDNFRFFTQGPPGVLELLMIASSKPLGNTLRALREIASRQGTRSGPIISYEPGDLIVSLLDDLDTKERGNSNIHSLDLTQLAVMSISLEVI